MSSNRLRILSVGGNAVSAFISWRLQATNACDVTLVWKSGFETVSQYGISFRSKTYGNERFKPRAVVKSPEEAAGPPGFDYVLVCVKALPDVYDLAAVIESVVTPQLTCIIINTTNAIGIESYLETRFPTNVVLSLCSGVNINQTGASDFEHIDSSEVWVGSANTNPNIPVSVQGDMAEALALTLQSGSVDCCVSENIRQQQWERMIGPIAFHPLSVLIETPDLASLVDMPGMRALIECLLDELLHIAEAQGCAFPSGFSGRVFETMSQSSGHNTMYQDFISRRPMEVEILLGSPIKMAKAAAISAPHLQTLYPLLHHINSVNQTKSATYNPPHENTKSITEPNVTPHIDPRASLPGHQELPGRIGSGYRGQGVPKRPQSSLTTRQHHNGTGGRNPGPSGANYGSRRNSFDNDLEEFGHIAMYGEMIHADDTDELIVSSTDEVQEILNDQNHRHVLSMRERELQLKQRELAIKEQELALHRIPRGAPRRRGARHSNYEYDDDDDNDDNDDYLDHQPHGEYIHPDNIDMMSVTSRRNRRFPVGGGRGGFGTGPHRTSYQNHTGGKVRNKDRATSALIGDFPTPNAAIADDPLLNFSSNRYPTIHTSRTNSLVGQKFDEFAPGPGPIQQNIRRMSASGPYHPNGAGMMAPNMASKPNFK